MQPPTGSKIKFTQLPNGAQELSWSNESGGLLKYVIALFTLGILCFFFFWTKNAFPIFIDIAKDNSLIYLILIAVCLAIIYLITLTILMLKPARNESLLFRIDSFSYDEGNAFPFDLMAQSQYKPMPFIKALLNKSYRKDNIMRGELEINFESNPSRVYFDDNLQRIEIGKKLSEPEIEWLYEQIKSWSK